LDGDDDDDDAGGGVVVVGVVGVVVVVAAAERCFWRRAVGVLGKEDFGVNDERFLGRAGRRGLGDFLRTGEAT
jgi:hypothetical protein